MLYEHASGYLVKITYWKRGVNGMKTLAGEETSSLYEYDLMFSGKSSRSKLINR